MSCLQIALQRMGRKVDNYYASEIDKHAIRATQLNFPNTFQLGDIKQVSAKDLPRIDLIGGGSPCQGFSFAGKGLNFEDPRSKLFFEFVRLWKECKEINPEVKFFLENVRMLKAHEEVISKLLGVNPILINSALVSAQNRERLYWTNIGLEPSGLFGDLTSIIQQPKDKGIVLRDILEEQVDEKYYLSDKALARIGGVHKTDRGIRFHRGDERSSGISELGTVADEGQTCDSIIASHVPKIRHKNFMPQINPEKTGTLLSGNQSGKNTDHGTTYIRTGAVNNHGTLEFHDKSHAIDSNYFKGMDNSNQRTHVVVHKQRGTGPLKREDGKTYCLDSCSSTNNLEVRREVIQVNESKESGGVQPYQQNRIYSENGILPALNAELSGRNNVETRDRIRRLTPGECCRLQTVPDHYFTFGTAVNPRISETQQYRMLGNGWTIDVIVHILNYWK